MITAAFLTLTLVGLQDTPAPNRVAAFSDAYQSCFQRDPSNANVSHCQEAELALQTGRLDAIIEARRVGLSAEESADMDRFLQHWRNDRDEHCRTEAGDLPGAAFGRVLRECQIAATLNLITDIDTDQAD